MAILKRINKYQGLKDIDVLVDEKGLTSQYFNITQIPTAFPQGRSSFIIGGSPFLKNNVELKIEILDSAGNTVYTEPIQNYLEGDGRRVSVEIYNDTAPGDCFLYIVGELKDNYQSISPLIENQDEVTGGMPELALDTQDVPPEFRGVYNVRYSRPINISTTIPNSEPILFYNQPRVTVSEILKGYVVEVPVSASVSITGSAELTPQNGITTLPPIPDPDPSGFPTIDTSTREDVGKSLEIFKNRRSSKIEPLRFNNFKSRGRIMRRSSPEIDRNEILIENMESGLSNDGDEASSAFVGGNITINNPVVDFGELPGDSSRYEVPTTYTSQISKVKNSKTIVPLDDFIITDKQTGERLPVKIQPNNEVTMSYVPTPDPTISTTHFRAFADITLGNLTTFSGDVFKARISARSRGTLGDFETLYDSTIEAPTILIDTFSTTGFKNVGYFYTGSILTDYWDTSNGTATIDNSKIIDSVLISGSNQGFTPGVGESTSGAVQSDRNSVIFATSQSYDLEKNVPYTVSFDAYYYKSPKDFSKTGDTQDFAELEVIISGSARLGTTNEDYSLGKVQVPTDSSEGEIRGIHNTFVSSTTGDPKLRLKFKATAGRWIIHDVEIKPYSETNFNPDYFRTILPMPHPMPKKPDEYDFLVEFFDVNNNIAETIVVKENVVFNGAPVNIEGDGNLLSGSMYLGNTEGSGIEMHGGSAFLRSIGYEGFDNTISSNLGGFLIFSGSVGSRISASENYEGVGLEIVDAHGATNRFMKFRTDPSTFQVQTDEFFLGSTSQFVSGSNGNIEISSSNFHLTNAGDVTLAGTITATAGNIGDFQIINGQISGSNITMNATRSQIFKTDQGPGSDTSAVFENLRDEYYIDFTPSESIDKVNNYRPGYYIKMGPNFMVDKDGILIASGATFEGSITASAGLIGGFTTDSHSFSSNNIFISGSPAVGGVDSDEYMFISTSNFNVKQNGDVTASEFLLSGGTITDNVTILGSVSANSILTPATIGGSPATVANASSSITSEGFAKFVSASIAGFIVNTEEIKSSDESLRLKATGQITGSNVLFSGGKIAAWNISGTNLSSIGDGGIRLNGNGDNAEISVNSHTFGNAGIQLGYNSGAPRFYVGDGSNNFLKFTTANGVDIKTIKFELDTPTLEISSAEASMSLGSSQEVLIRGNSNSPFFSIQPSVALVDKSYGEVGVFFGVASGTTPLFSVVGSGGHIKFNGTGIDLASATFDLDAGTIIMDSSTNNGKIALGATPPTAHNSGDGFYVDGNGKILIGSGSGDRIQFDGTDFTVQVGSLELDANNIEISSTQASMSIGEGNIILDGDNSKIKVGKTSNKLIEVVGSSTQGYIATGKTSATSTTAGFWLANNDGDPEFHVGNTSNFVKFDGGNFNLASENLEISSSTIQISTAESSMSFGHDNTATDGKIIIEGSGTPSFRVGPDAKNLSLTAGSGVFIDGAGNFKFGDSDGNVTFNGGSFSITGSDVAINVTDINISSSAFEVSSTEASMSLGTNKQWKASGNGTNPFLSIGQTTQAFDNTGIFLGYVSSAARPKVSFIGSSGHIKFDDGVDIATTTFELDTSGIEISSGEASMSIGDSGNNPITLISNGDDRSIRFGSKTDFDQTTTAGFIMGIDNGNAKFDFTIGSSNNNYIRLSSAGVDIKTQQFLLDTTNLDINSATSRISVSDGSNERVRIGEISDSASDLFGMKIYDGSGTADGNTLVKLGEEGNEIAGWTISNDALTGGKMIIRQDGTIESSGFASNVAGSGFRLTAANGGFLEVENAKIRGTMATTVFEKESVNAVGGQLYVANSTTIKSGSIITAAATTMSVDNVSGFVANEILSAKKINTTGFSTEYILVNSASRDNPSSQTDFSGKLMVTRAYGSGTTGDSGSLGDSPSTAVPYSGSQVIVSTGKIGTGFIRLNANPNDQTTPYIDIIERTGSAIYDVELKARLGDLSGISSGLLYGNTNPGFGLFTENVFLSGAITATTGSFTGIVHIGTSPSEEMRLGTDVSSTNDGLHINNNNYWYTTGAFKVGSSNFFLSNDSSGNISIQPKELTLQVSDGSGGHKFELAGTATEQSMSFNNEDVVLGSDGSRGFARIGRNTAKAIFVTGSQDLGAIRIAKDSFSDDTAGFWLANQNGTPQFYIGNSTSHLKFDGSDISLSGDAFDVTASNVDISTGTISVDADDFQLSSTEKSMSLGYDSNSSAGMEFVGGSTTTIKFGQPASPKLTLQSDSSNAFLRIGSQTHGGTEGGIIIGDESGVAKLDLFTDADNFFRFNNSEISIRTNTFDFQGTNLALNNTRFFLGTITSDSDSSGAGVYMDNGGAFRLFGDSTNFITVDGGSMAIGTDDFNLNTAKGDIIFNSGVQRISMGDSPPTDFSNNGIILSGSGFFNFQSGTNEYLRSSGDGVELKAARLNILTTGTNKIKIDSTSTTPQMALGSTLPTAFNSGQGFFVDGAGNFLLGNASGNHMKFNASTGNLDVVGTITIGASSPAVPLPEGVVSSSAQIASDISGSTVLPDGLISGSAQIADEISGSFTSVSSSFETTTAAAQTAADNAQTSANTVSSNLTSVSSSFETTTAAAQTAADNAQTSANTNASNLTSVSSSFETSVSASQASADTVASNLTSVSSSFETSVSASQAAADTVADNLTAVSSSFETTTANNSTAASNAQNAVDLIESQLILSASGMTLRSTGQAPDFDLARFGTTTKVFDGVGSSEGNRKLQLSSAGVFVFGDDVSTYAYVRNSGVQLVEDGSERANFASTTTIGNTATEHVEITPTSLKLKDGNGSGTDIDYVTITSSGMQIGAVSSGITLNTSGDATFNGSITLVGSDIQGLTGSLDSTISANSASLAEETAQLLTASQSMQTQVVLDSGGMSLKNSDASKTFASYGTTTTIGETGTEHVEITSTSLKLKDDTTDLVTISGTTITIGSDTDNRVTITPTSMQIGSVSNGITMDANGDATFNGTLSLVGSDIAGLTGSLDSSITTAQNTANTANTNAATAQAGVDSINATSSSLENPTTFTPTTAAGTSDGLHLGSDKMGYVSSGTYQTYMDNSGNFYLGGTSGALTWTAGTSTLDVNRITATTGTIGAFNIGTNTLESSNAKLILDGSSDGKIRLGSTPPTSATSGTGIFLGGDGTFLAGSSSGNRIQFTSGGAVVLQSSTFSLDASTIIMDSATNSGKIALGSSPNTSVSGTNQGVYMDGTGDFLARGDGDNFIKLDGTSLSMSSETFDLNAGSGKLILESSTPSLTLNDSNAFLRVGGLTSIDSGSTNRGVYMEGDGDILFKASSSAHTDYLKFTNDGLELKTSTLTFKTDGNIESQDFLIERTRLFGAGQDHTGTFRIKEDFCDGSDLTVTSADDSFPFMRRSTDNSPTVQLERDAFFTSLTIANGHTLKTNGFRLYVKDTLTIAATGQIDCSGGTGGSGSGRNPGLAGSGGGSGDDLGLGTSGIVATLEGGPDGSLGGKGGPQPGITADINGSGGGSGGGGGGILFIAAKIINNNANNGYGIVAEGGGGGTGADGGELLN